MDTQSARKDATGIPCKKINMIGHSHGAGLMLAAMSYTVKADRYVSQMIGIEPCLLPRPDAFYPGLDYTEYNLLTAATSIFEIDSFFGPNWDD